MHKAPHNGQLWQFVTYLTQPLACILQVFQAPLPPSRPRELM